MTITDAQAIFKQMFGCTCVAPEKAVTLVRQLLKVHPMWNLDNQDILNALVGNVGAQNWLLCDLHKAGLTEYSSSVYGAWLSTKGKELLLLLETHEPEEFV